MLRILLVTVVCVGSFAGNETHIIQGRACPIVTPASVFDVEELTTMFTAAVFSTAVYIEWADRKYQVYSDLPFTLILKFYPYD
jgi:hypothetical protein